ncbi:MAG: hypothetical protein ACRENE_02625 [Polyangiaceae bacterium]
MPLLVWDASPGSFPAHAHDLLGAVPLAIVGVACLMYPLARRARAADVAKASIAAAAFFAWAANQYWADHPKATLMNDVAVALFVVDVVLGVFGWPPPDVETEQVASPIPPT